MPGETVRVQVVGERGAARVAEVIRVESPSPRRAAPLPPFRALRRVPLPAHRLRDTARAQGTAPQADSSRGGRARRIPSRSRPSRLARPLRLPEQDGVRLRREAAAGSPSGSGRRSRPQAADLPADPAARRVPDFRPRRRARLSRPRSNSPGRTASKASSRRRAGEPPPPRPPAGQADRGAHGRPGDGRARRTRARRRWRGARGRRPGAPELRPRHEQPRLGLRRATRATRLVAGAPFIEETPGRPRHSGSIRRPSSRRTRPAPSSSTAGSADEAPLGAGEPRPRTLLRQRGDRALARRRGGRVTGIDSSPGQHRQRRGERPRQRHRERRVRAGHGRGPADGSLREPADVVVVDPPRVGLTARPSSSRPRRRARYRLRLLQPGIARPRSPRLPRRGVPGLVPLALRPLPPHPAPRNAGRARPLSADGFTFAARP